MAEHSVTACDQCGAQDDHPKVHFGTETFHHDCLPQRVEQVLHSVAVDIVAAAKSGIRGADLRAHIKQLHGEDA